MSDAPGGMVDANRLLLLRVGVGFLTAVGGPSGGVGSCGASDVAVAHRLTEQWPVVSWPRFSQGVWLVGRLLLSICDSLDPKGGELLSIVSIHLQLFGAMIVCTCALHSLHMHLVI